MKKKEETQPVGAAEGGRRPTGCDRHDPQIGGENPDLRP